MHDGRSVAKWLVTPTQADTPSIRRTLSFVKDADHRARIVASLEEREGLESHGAGWLSLALQEIHGRLYREAYPETDGQRLQSVKMMFDVWARLPAPGRED